MEGKLPASTITTSLNTFPLNPPLNTFLLNCQAVNILGQVHFSFLKGNRSYCRRKRKKKPPPLKVQSTNDYLSSAALWITQVQRLLMVKGKNIFNSTRGQPGPATNYQQSLEEMSPLDQVWLFTTSATLKKWEILPARTIQ